MVGSSTSSSVHQNVKYRSTEKTYSGLGIETTSRIELDVQYLGILCTIGDKVGRPLKRHCGFGCECDTISKLKDFSTLPDKRMKQRQIFVKMSCLLSFFVEKTYLKPNFAKRKYFFLRIWLNQTGATIKVKTWRSKKIRKNLIKIS